MEYALREGISVFLNRIKCVLILVLMEYALRDLLKVQWKGVSSDGLNPCFNGICSAREAKNCHSNYCLES